MWLVVLGMCLIMGLMCLFGLSLCGFRCYYIMLGWVVFVSFVDCWWVWLLGVFGGFGC